MAREDVKVGMRVDNRKLGGDLGKSRSMFKRAFKNIGRGIKGTLSKVFSPLGIGLSALGIGAVVNDVIKFEDVLQRLTDQAGVTSPRAIDKIRKQMIALSRDTGLSRASIADAQKELVDLIGPTGLSAAKLDLLAEANLATGASMKDLAGLSFVLGKALDLNTPLKLKLGLSAIATAGQFGSISMAEMVPVMKQVAASMRALSGGGVGGTAQLASALQLLIGKGFASAAEAGTALESVLSSIAKKEKVLAGAKIGINVREMKDGKKQFIGLIPLLEKFRAKGLTTFGDLIGILGRKEPAKALAALIPQIDALRKLSALSAKQTAKNNSIETRAGNRRNSRVFKLKKSLNDVKESIAKAFTPERIEQFAALMEKVAVAVGFIADNLLLTAGVFGTIKVGGFLLAMRGAAVAAGVTATATGATAVEIQAASLAAGRFALAMKAARVAAGLTGAAIAGWMIGKQIDKWTGASNKIASAVFKGRQAPGTEDADQGFMRDRLDKLRAATSRQIATGKSGLTTEQTLSQARAAVAGGKQTGAFGPSGEVTGVERASKARTTVFGGRQFTFGPDRLATQELKDAVKLLKDAAEANAKGLKITIGVDPATRTLVVKTEKGDDDSSRRSTK